MYLNDAHVVSKMDILDDRRKFRGLIQITKRCRFHMQNHIRHKIKFRNMIDVALNRLIFERR